MDEAQLVELDNGMIMANMRNNHLNPCDCRGVSLSSDSGETFGNITFDPTLISPVRGFVTYSCMCNTKRCALNGIATKTL